MKVESPVSTVSFLFIHLILRLESNAGLHEQNTKMKSEIQILRSQVREKQIQIDELVAQIKLMADADK